MLNKTHRRAFTLLEMAIVLFIISLLVLIVLPNLSTQREHATEIHENAMTNVVQTQLDLYENDTGQRAQSIDQLVENQYLTAAQAQKATSEHIKVVNGRAERK
ncbi:MAG: competence type IV pilus major pilin ComGC [Lactobacillus sp.]|nr:competence type IV pilus major pilin ComGC [Lactobacillus sp.]